MKQKKKYDVVSIGGATRDIIFYSGQGKLMYTPEDLTRQKMLAFEHGAKVISEEVFFSLGGGGCNTAVAFARLGLKVASIVRVGKDREGDAILDDLQEEGVDTEFIERDDSLSTGFSFIAVDKKTKDHVAFLYRGANSQLVISDSQLEKIPTKWFYVTSLTGRNWPKTALAIARNVKLRGIKLAWNPGETQLKGGVRNLTKLLKVCDVLFLNLDEATELVLSAERRFSQIGKPGALAMKICSFGPKIVIITFGRKGVQAYDGEKLIVKKAKNVPTKDTTGAGDCFGASFLTGMIKYNRIDKSLKMGIENTASLVQKIGAQSGLLKWKDLKNKL